jgi:hypothetical protein
MLVPLPGARGGVCGGFSGVTCKPATKFECEYTPSTIGVTNAEGVCVATIPTSPTPVDDPCALPFRGGCDQVCIPIDSAAQCSCFQVRLSTYVASVIHSSVLFLCRVHSRRWCSIVQLFLGMSNPGDYPEGCNKLLQVLQKCIAEEKINILNER